MASISDKDKTIYTGKFPCLKRYHNPKLTAANIWNNCQLSTA